MKLALSGSAGTGKTTLGRRLAAETGLPLIRVSSEGYSALIDRTGKIVQKTKLDSEELLQVEFPALGSVEAGGEEATNPLIEDIGRLKRS